VDAPVSLLDLAPTLLDLAGVPFGEVSADGESLAGLLAGDSPEGRGPVVSEYHAEGVNAPAAMIRSGRHKLIVCRADPDLLFDLDADPLELSNLADSALGAPVVRSLRDALAARLDLDAVERRVLESQRERRVVVAGLSRGDVAAWDYQPFVDASTQYVRTREDLYDLQRRARLDAR
jgi:choline-sulfatase